ncbi:DEAD/DEAH box helicase [Nocardioides sp. 503]|uniref:DEAD/DEAH box helicase n=1 Tax=Nocardioides sp. 503 TaxID=2508326 RepID=UPI00106F7F7C|nr:DEAD/DEAH box helicase [Nocardioides sp. 503]
MTAIHAETDAGCQDLILVAGSVGDPTHEGVARAAKRLKLLTPLFSTTEPAGALRTPLTWAAVVQLSATFGTNFVPGPRLCEWITAQTLARTTALPVDEPLDIELPAGLVPRPYQVDGAREIARTGRQLIFDEPRTGKTITTILGLALRSGPGHLGGLPILVVCPASVVDPWVEAFNAWAPYWKAVAWRGTPKKRHALAGTADVYVTSYDTARQDTPVIAKGSALLDLDARSLVVDESHFVKNPHAGRTKSVQRLARDVTTFVALSGTPITHHPGDLWPALRCLEPHAWPSRERWVNRYCQTLPGDYGDEILGLARHAEPEFRLTLLGQHRRIARADVMGQLPPKTYSVRTVDLPAKWRKAYDDMESQMLAELPDGSEMSVMSVLAQLTRLSQLASAPANVVTTVDENELGPDGMPKVHTEVTLEAPSWKVDALLEVLDERPGEKVVVFAPSRQLIMLAGAAAEKAGHRVGYIVGGQAQGVRTETIRSFQHGDLNLICATTGAGGTGITLSAAGTLLFLQRPWSLVESVQAEDRGEGDMEATHGTEVIDVVARNTIDTRVRAVLRERAGQLADLVQDPRIVAELLGGTTTERKSA